MVGRGRYLVPLAAFAVVAMALSSLLAVRAQPPPPPGAPAPPARQTLSFVTHAAFFSADAHRLPAIDPQVFVKDDAAAEGTGPQSIMHVAGLRTARMDDVPEAALFNAAGDALGFTVEKWFAASGTVDMDAIPGGGVRLTLTFKRLIAFGVYSLFREAFSPDGQTFYPIDGDGSSNSFTASVDGGAIIVMSSPVRLTHNDAIVLVLHSDSQEHGVSRGLIGINAHEQLIARMP